jgi:glycosyltransferase involved in cell wall biosynthesis
VPCEPFDFLVVIPTCRRPRLLGAAIASAVGQVGATKIVIVVDDCPDGSAEPVVRDFRGAGVIYLRNPAPTDGWPGSVRNRGFEASRDLGLSARFVHFLDDDDLVPDDHYRRVKQAFGEHPDVGVVFGAIQSFCEFSDDPVRRRAQEQRFACDRRWRANAARVARIYEALGSALKAPRLTQWLYALQAMCGPELFLCSGGVIRHEHVLRLGGFDPRYRLMEDYEFYTRAMRSFGAHFLGEVSALYRFGGSDSLWAPQGLDATAELARADEISRALRLRKRAIRAEVGNDLAFLVLTMIYRLAIGPLVYGLGAPGALLRSAGRMTSPRRRRLRTRPSQSAKHVGVERIVLRHDLIGALAPVNVRSRIVAG